MHHYGDITKIHGAIAPVVDTVIFGAPCQDLSVAGKRAGMKHGDLGDEEATRSGLFMEAVRIIKEMRAEDERNGRTDVDIRPRYGIYENVPGAFSSNSGRDFQVVLEELAKVKDPNAVIPRPADGKWRSSGCIVGRGWSIAWRVLDAQFWGTSDKPLPQRRRRIALVADFGGESAPEILFVRESVSGHLEPGEPKRKEAPSDASRGVGADDKGGKCFGISSYDSNAFKSSNPHSGVYEADTSRTLDLNGGNPSCNQGGIAVVENVPYTLKIRSGVSVDSSGKAAGKGALIQEDLSATLGVSQDQYLFQPVGAFCPETGGNDPSRSVAYQEGVSPTLRSGFTPAAVYSVENHPNDSRVGINEDGKVQALTSRMGTGGGNVPMVMQCYSKSKRAQTATDNETWVESETANTLNAFDVGDVRTTECVVALDRASFNQGKNAQYDFEVSDKGVNSPLVAKGPSAVCYSVDQGGGKSGVDVREGKAPTLTTTHDGAPAVAYCIGNGQAHDAQKPDRELCKTLNCMDDPMKICVAVDARNGTEGSVTGALQSNSAHSLNGNNAVRTRYIVRRLTPLECERLQGYPDGWTDIGEYIDSTGKKRQTSDAARYKALGNSIALPPWKWVLKRLCACYERDATMASLFDGIGGFPYLWEQLNGKGSCLWASEIEEFPMAVTKVRIGE